MDRKVIWFILCLSFLLFTSILLCSCKGSKHKDQNRSLSKKKTASTNFSNDRLFLTWISPPKKIERGDIRILPQIRFSKINSRNLYVDTLNNDKYAELMISNERKFEHNDYDLRTVSNWVFVHLQQGLSSPYLLDGRGPIVVDDTLPHFGTYPTVGELDIRDVFINDIEADSADIINNGPSNYHLEDTRIKHLTIANLLDGIDYPLINVYYQPFDLDQISKGKENLREQQVLKTISIYQSTIGEILSDRIANLKVTKCVIADTAKINCEFATRFIFDDVRFRSTSGLLNMTHPKDKAILSLRKFDASKIDFDYTYFQYVPFPQKAYESKNEWYSDVTRIYQSIISSQERLNNIDGIRQATIEMREFKDSQLFFGPLLIWLQVHWNNYGFEKEKVILSSALIFIFFLFINLVWLDKFLENYDVAGILQARTNSRTLQSFYKRWILKFLHSAIYAGVIFYGLKFDFGKLQTKNIGIVWVLILEYILGLISLAYIANLIITK